VNYYYTDSGNRPQGPLSLEEIRAMAQRGQLDRGTMVAVAGNSVWTPLASLLPDVALQAPGRTDPLAVWSLILGIVGFIACSCCGPLLSVPAIVTGHISLSNCSRDPKLEGKGMAIAGLVTGYVAIAIFIAQLFLFGGLVFIEEFSKGISE
jgi:hypothetical protein